MHNLLDIAIAHGCQNSVLANSSIVDETVKGSEFPMQFLYETADGGGIHMVERAKADARFAVLQKRDRIPAGLSTDHDDPIVVFEKPPANGKAQTAGTPGHKNCLHCG